MQIKRQTKKFSPSISKKKKENKTMNCEKCKHSKITLLGNYYCEKENMFLFFNCENDCEDYKEE